MQKLANSILEKLFKCNITAKEIDFLLYIARFQNQHGCVQGVYYRDVCENAKLSYQAFYDVKKSLTEKGIITTQKNYTGDWDITILDNDFSTKESFGRGYINLGHYIFTQENFRKMKAGTKLMAMDILKINMTGGTKYEIGTKKFYKKYMELLSVQKKIVEEYLREIKLFFYVGIKDKKYFITLRDVMKKLVKKTENEQHQEHSVSVALRRNRIEKSNIIERDRREVQTLLRQYNKEISLNEDVAKHFDLATIIKSSLEKINVNEKNKYKWKRILKPKLIHMLLRQELGLV